MFHHILRGRGPNTMSVASLTALRADLAAHPQAPILLSGNGQAFSAGLDIDALIADGPTAIARAIEDAAEALFLHPAPTVAAINGHAIAGGCLLAQACDLRVLNHAPSVRMGMPGVALGINYPPKLLCILRHRIPPHGLDRVLLEAANHGPAQALALGLVDELVDDAVAAGQQRLQALASHPAAAYAEAKRALRAHLMDVPAAERERFDALAAERWSAESLAANRRDKPGHHD